MRRIRNSDAFFHASSPQHPSAGWIGRFWFNWMYGVAQRLLDRR